MNSVIFEVLNAFRNSSPKQFRISLNIVEVSNSKNKDHGIQPIFIISCVLAIRKKKPRFICEHFDPSVDAGKRYYHKLNVNLNDFERVYGVNVTNLHPRDWIIQPIVNTSCIGESPGKELGQCKFNGYLTYDELCNPCKVKEFKEECEELCEITTGPVFGGYEFV